MNLTKEVKDFWNEIFKTLKKNVKTLQDGKASCDCEFQDLILEKCLSCLKQIYRLNVFPTKFQCYSLEE